MLLAFDGTNCVCESFDCCRRSERLRSRVLIQTASAGDVVEDLLAHSLEKRFITVER